MDSLNGLYKGYVGAVDFLSDFAGDFDVAWGFVNDLCHLWFLFFAVTKLYALLTKVYQGLNNITVVVFNSLRHV